MKPLVSRVRAAVRTGKSLDETKASITLDEHQDRGFVRQEVGDRVVHARHPEVPICSRYLGGDRSR